MVFCSMDVYMTACVDSSFFDSCLNLAQLNFPCSSLHEDCFLDYSSLFPSVLRHDLHDDSFYSIMPVWQPAIVPITSAGVFLRVMSLQRDVCVVLIIS
jgi:hypothetical protein